ncbi:cbb3-type cytochrome oxidase assembly protein CcoS [Limibacter armeniacum]|uniref:cbb3-type cytochrome oxidase assembly protein CcoS n=1 Tax=Limibacter armeniacum TaxID=466084 RepID=UPI002FE5A912
MSAIVILIGISLVVAICFLLAFIWSVNSDQYDDTYTPSIRILFEENDYKRTNQSDRSEE